MGVREVIVCNMRFGSVQTKFEKLEAYMLMRALI